MLVPDVFNFSRQEEMLVHHNQSAEREDRRADPGKHDEPSALFENHRQKDECYDTKQAEYHHVTFMQALKFAREIRFAGHVRSFLIFQRRGSPQWPPHILSFPFPLYTYGEYDPRHLRLLN